MDVGKHRVSVICANKREGKQKASQAMLKKLHPNVNNVYKNWNFCEIAELKIHTLLKIVYFPCLEKN